MAVSDLDVRASYVGNGANLTFAINFAYQSSSQVKVYVNTVLQTPVTNYNIVGGNVVFVSAPAAAAVVLVQRETPLTQDLDLVNTGTYNSEGIETQLDRLVMMIQELEKRVEDLEA